MPTTTIETPNVRLSIGMPPFRKYLLNQIFVTTLGNVRWYVNV
jgi:hypothetical protein